VILTHDDRAVVDALVARLEVGGNDVFFQHVHPMPEGTEDWYSWCVENWGTKWDTSQLFWSQDDKSLFITCETAWSPPVGVYRKLEEQGWKVDAMYYETGCVYIGRFRDGQEEDYEWNFENENSLDHIPEDLLAWSGLQEDLMMYLAEQEEEEKNWNDSFEQEEIPQ
jgi:hypothetical protein